MNEMCKIYQSKTDENYLEIKTKNEKKKIKCNLRYFKNRH